MEERAPRRPIRGGTGGWRDPWDAPDDLATDIRRQAATQKAAGLRVGAAWRAEIAAEASTARRRGSARPGA